MKNTLETSRQTELNTAAGVATYICAVDREEIHTIGLGTLAKERLFQKGKLDRKNGEPCRSANGAYLNGWYATPEQEFYYIPKAASHLL